MKTLGLASLFLALTPAMPALAQDTTQSPPPAGQGVTRDAFVARQMGRIMAADTDGDGRVSKAELTAMMAGRGDPDRQFTRMDSNGDGYLDKAEITAALTERFNRMDRNGDGVLTPDERMRPGEGMRGGGMRGGAGGQEGMGDHGMQGDGQQNPS
ncbi:hypothetical protein J2792_001075 [Novosphingobium capsulatum]|uniref:EF-hand domain-containing protein n=1 Tax=Novosphingobium capsulatum TaxID=13688 RepID=A0ABU1MIT8_9SPHN|nr:MULTISPECIES: EF-hand domain-containing protein [Novosphingobium]KPF56587.1 hypothetical protein IP65_02045 [Novosphingobium sp. AAP1]MDR6510215.1 hypothetical protein [Novosphingobium capsulatum]PTR12239.1 EF hand domain-containing protein [Novosphingobium sp. GV055]PUB05640.1 EF hand domain-containing protein [Novosphingobium sp. GV061]PUB21873.1 EF hand domain-containing protein [Novosphingobium sp. GV079]